MFTVGVYMMILLCENNTQFYDFVKCPNIGILVLILGFNMHTLQMQHVLN